MTWPIPAGLDAARAACVPVAFAAAYECLFIAGGPDASWLDHSPRPADALAGPRFSYQLFSLEGFAFGLNYGYNRVRVAGIYPRATVWCAGKPSSCHTPDPRAGSSKIGDDGSPAAAGTFTSSAKSTKG